MILRRDALWEYLRGALWALPTVAVVFAFAVGSVLSRVDIPRDSMLHPLVFQGTVDDARTLLIGIAGTMITVIAIVLGLTVVALTLASTQYSPRLLRDFLRDRPNQLVLSTFVATFAYSTAGLYTVGLSAGSHTNEFPRLAVSGALVLLFISLGALVFEVHHLSHSMQIDQIMRRVERHTLQVIRQLPEASDDRTAPLGVTGEVPAAAATIRARYSGYVQTIRAEHVVGLASTHDANVRFCVRVGDHVVAGTTPLARVWRDTDRPVEAAPFVDAVEGAVRIGFERTLEQDAAFGMRQLVDVASKALSPAVNDPYTAVQAVDHLAVLMCELSRRRLGIRVVPVGDVEGGPTVIVPGVTFAEYVDLACAQVRRYGASEPMVARALLQLLQAVASTTSAAACRAPVADQTRLIQADTEREVRQGADLALVRGDVLDLLASLGDTGTGAATDLLRAERPA